MEEKHIELEVEGRELVGVGFVLEFVDQRAVEEEAGGTETAESGVLVGDEDFGPGVLEESEDIGSYIRKQSLR